MYVTLAGTVLCLLVDACNEVMSVYDDPIFSGYVVFISKVCSS